MNFSMMTLTKNDKKLSNHSAESLEGEILLTELSHALKDMKNDKSPGLDGFSRSTVCLC